jgi:hypothetical protein
LLVFVKVASYTVVQAKMAAMAVPMLKPSNEAAPPLSLCV